MIFNNDCEDPSLTGDALELYAECGGVINVATRPSVTSGWSAMAVVPGLDTSNSESTPEITPDGLIMFFSRDGAGDGDDVFMTTRTTRQAGWGPPVYIDDLTGTSDDIAATPSTDGLTIVMASNRDGATFDLYTATRAAITSNSWSGPVRIAELSTAQQENEPMLSGDKLTIYFSALRAGSYDLFYATRANATAPFGPEVQMSETYSTSNDNDAWISPDGRRFVFASDRGGQWAIFEMTR